jgi:probable HAF family extracellular repeat protein
MVDLGLLGGRSATAHGINEAGRIMGALNIQSLGNRMFAGNETDGLSELVLAAGITEASAAFAGSLTHQSLSEAGHIVGRGRTELFGLPTTVAFFWSDATGMVNLGTLPSTPGRTPFSIPVAVNDRGEVAGSSSIGVVRVGEGHAFRWSQATGIVDLGTLPLPPGGRNRSDAADMNAAGIIVGISETTSPDGVGTVQHATRWLPDNTVEDLGVLGDPTVRKFSEALAINDRGQVTGSSSNDANQRVAFLWEDGVGMQDLGTLSGNFSEGTLINERGHVAGTNGARGFFWSLETGMVDLGIVPDGIAVEPLDMNNTDQIVGRVFVDPPGPARGNHAFLWTQQDGIMDLGAIAELPDGSIQGHAFAINDRGDIVGRSTAADQLFHAFLLPGATPQTVVEDLIEIVGDLDLKGGLETALLASLTNALDKIGDGAVEPAIGMLEAFINKVEAQRGKALTDEEADSLIALARQAVELITASE